ncbi:MAG: polysaccharide pyruvyl transferase family protein, partial [Gammaproteobacteria bacterium]|nr:polysaccharide pyruvyl transferase family protein [Gammaproteobacteria bacterium]
FRRVVEAATLIFARDRQSFQFCQDVVGADSRIRMAPDFTNLLKPALMMDGASSRRILIVPNRRMIDMPGKEVESGQYKLAMAAVVASVSRLGWEPALLAHGSEDVPLIREIHAASGASAETISESDPLKLKQLIGESHAVVGSRFHALVSAFSQGVPALGTSWSHKYEMLFEDYGVPELLLGNLHPASVGDSVERLLDRRPQLSSMLRERSALIESRASAMWDEVCGVLQ